MIEAISLKNPYPNGVDVELKHQLNPFIDTLNEIRNKIQSGERVYIRITAGEREGSIAYIWGFDPDYTNKDPIITYNRTFHSHTARITNDTLYVILRWDKRQNRIKWITHTACEYLRGYDGPTVWEKFDKKAAEKKLLKNEPVYDRDKNILKEGDRVLYINARYGFAASLDRGTIKKIKYSVFKTTDRDKTYDRVHVIIKNDNGEESNIKNPELSILKV